MRSLVVLALTFSSACAFVAPRGQFSRYRSTSRAQNHEIRKVTTSLEAKGGKRKKRRRKKTGPPAASSPPPVVPTPQPVVSKVDDATSEDEELPLPPPGVLPDVPGDMMLGIDNLDEEGAPDANIANFQEVIKIREREEEEKRKEEELKRRRGKIKRSDKEAMKKLLMSTPFADADASYFEEEEYGTVEALLGERAKPFLGIPFGPLQVGHFIGALGIVLMAFVDYPGFPLTNLPSPLRGALQGGLGTVYAINTVLAVLAVFKAMERGQSPLLWAAKTFSVGGLAFDQLTQLPTLEEIEKENKRMNTRRR